MANGVYKESLVINAAITLMGSSMDSTVIDGTGLSAHTIKCNNKINIIGFNIIGKGSGDDINVEGFTSKGYHEVDFTSKKEYLTGTENTTGWNISYGDIVSGIYVYHIEVIDEGNIPVFSDMER